MRPLSALVLALLALGCEPDVRAVDLVVRTDTLGFQCREEPGGPALGARLIDASSACLVLDHVALDGFPRCRPEDIRRWCTGGRCVPLQRDTFPIAIPPPGTTDPGGYLVDQILGIERFEGPVGVGPVLLRLTIVAEGCDAVPALPAALDPDTLVGCVSSCPSVLTETDSVDLDLDVIGGQCTLQHVGACSRLGELD